HHGQLTFDPRLPDGWPSLTWRMRWRTSRLRVRLEPEAMVLAVEVGEPVTLRVRGEQVEVGEQEVRVPIEGHGPRLEREPRLKLVGDRPSPDRPHGVDTHVATGGVVPHSWSHELEDPTGPIPIRAPGRDV